LRSLFVRALIVTNMYPTPARPADGAFITSQVASLRDLGVEIEVCHLNRPSEGRSVYRGLAGKIHSLVSTTRPDVVHVQYGGVLANRVGRAVRDRPLLVSFCGDDLLGGGGGGLTDRAARAYNVIESRRAAGRADGIVVKSRNLFDALPRGLSKDRVWILPNGVDTRRFRPLDRLECQSALGWSPDRKHVLFPAPRSRPEKRFELATAAVAELNGGSEVELHALEGVSHDQVPTWMNAADAVVLTSSREGSPNAVKEALACNVPVVSVDVGDVRERLDGIDGCYVAEATPADLAEKLRLVLERGTRIDAGEHVETIAIDRVARKLLGIYETLTG
jgi:glycosyltransferase involved in cell wall biosynthesis